MNVVKIGSLVAYEGESARASKIEWELGKIFARYDIGLEISNTVKVEDKQDKPIAEPEVANSNDSDADASLG